MKKEIIQMPHLMGHLQITSTNIKTGKVRVEADCHNLIVAYGRRALIPQMGTNWILTNSWQPWFTVYSLLLGDGNTEPSGSDTALTHQLWERERLSYNHYITADPKVAKAVYTFSVPATTDFVGDVREVGLRVRHGNYPYYYALFSHALIKDAEDNPIEIHKDDLMQLDIRYEITFQGTDETPGLCLLLPGNGNDRWPVVLGENDNNGSYRTIRSYRQKGAYVRNIRGTFVGQLPSPYITKSVELSRDLWYTFWDENTYRASFAGTRIPATEGNNHYSECISFGGTLRFFKAFPNESIMPVTTLQGMNVGVGDGNTDEFTAPIPFWLADSEIIYIDNVPLVPNVDYTCDNYHNLQKYGELSPLSQAILVDGHRWYSPIGLPGFQGSVPVNGPADAAGITGYIGRRTMGQWNVGPNHPLILELPIDSDSARDWSMDVIELSWYSTNSLVSPNNLKPDIAVSYSDDLESWTLVGTLQVRAGSTLYSLTLDTPITAKYWKFDMTSYVASYWNVDSYSHNFGAGPHFRGYRRGRKIKFTTPPGAGAVITMDAQIDRPLKNDKHVIDFNPVVQF